MYGNDTELNEVLSSIAYLIKYHLNKEFLVPSDTTAVIERLNKQKINWVITAHTDLSALHAMDKDKIVVTVNKPKLSERISSAGFKFILNYIHLSHKVININSKTTKMIIDQFNTETLYEFRLGRSCDPRLVEYLTRKFPRSIYSINTMTPVEIEPLLTGKLVTCDHTISKRNLPSIDPQIVNTFLATNAPHTSQTYSRTLTSIGEMLIDIGKDLIDSKFNTEQEKSIINLILEWTNGCINYLSPGHDLFVEILCNLIELKWAAIASDDTLNCIEAMISLAESKNFPTLASALEKMYLNLLLVNIEATRRKPQRHVYDYELASTYAMTWIKKAVFVANSLIKKTQPCHEDILILLDNINRSLSTYNGKPLIVQHTISLALYFEIKNNLNLEHISEKDLIKLELEEINKIIIEKKLSIDLKTRNPELSIDSEGAHVSEISLYQQSEPTDLTNIMKNKKYVVLDGHLFFEHDTYLEAVIDDWSAKYRTIIRQGQSKAKFIDAKLSDFSRWYSTDKFWTILSTYCNATDYKDKKTLKTHFKPTAIIDYFQRVKPCKKSLDLLLAMLLENLDHKNKRELVELTTLWAKHQSIDLLTHLYSGITNTDLFYPQAKHWLELDHWLSALAFFELYNRHCKTVSLPGLSPTQYNLKQLSETKDQSVNSLHCIQQLLRNYNLSSTRELIGTELYKFINKIIQDFISHITEHPDTLERQYTSIELLLSLCSRDDKKMKSLINQWCEQAFDESSDLRKKAHIAAAYAKKDHKTIFSIAVNHLLPKAIELTKLEPKHVKRISECLSSGQQSALTINDSYLVFLFLADSNRLKVLVNKAKPSAYHNQLLTKLSSELWSSVTYSPCESTLLQCVSHDGLQLSINNKDHILKALNCKTLEDLLAITPHVGQFNLDNCKNKNMYFSLFYQHIAANKVTIDKTGHISSDIDYMYDLLSETQQRELAWSWVEQSVKNAAFTLIKLISDKLNLDKIPFTIVVSRKSNKLLYTLRAQGIHNLVMSEQEFLTLKQPLQWLLEKPSLQRLELLFYSITEQSKRIHYSDKSAIESIKAYRAMKYLKSNHVLKQYTRIMTTNLRDRVISAFRDEVSIIPLKRSEFDVWHQHLHQKFPELGTVYVFGTACLFWLKEIIRGHHHELNQSISKWDTSHSGGSFPIQLTCDNPIERRTNDRIFQEKNKGGELVFSSYCYQVSDEHERLQFYDFNDKLKENIIPLGVAIRLSANKRAEIIIDHNIVSLRDHALVITQWDEILRDSPNWIEHERCRSFMQTPV